MILGLMRKEGIEEGDWMIIFSAFWSLSLQQLLRKQRDPRYEIEAILGFGGHSWRANLKMGGGGTWMI